jgi:hydroxyquinol 1,2-dioxygenase
VTDPRGQPVGGAVIDVWQTASSGFYAVQQPGIQDPHNCRGLFKADDDGCYEFRTVRPADYPIPGDGPVGRLLAATGRGLMRAGHVHVMVSAPGFKTLITHVFDSSSDYLLEDAVFGVRQSLVRHFDTPSADVAGGGDDAGEEDEAVIGFDIVLTPA